ncbi:MAG: signal peptidase II [Dethiobacter sp.]|nr:signal peptidase II [Dethiobacter sp.]MCL4463498.1 signal peptidase II [Bacillota bacterium]MCL5993962.1 signal peptidase II [Bacillota bacterium]
MLILLLAVLVILFDQLLKLLVVNTMSLNQSIPVITNIFHITYVHNFGAAFGLLAHRTGFIILVTVVVVFLLLVFLRHLPKEQKLLRAALVLQLAGATGNLIDRVRMGYVVDFFDLRVWPVFNVADIAIVSGIGLLILDLTRNTREKGV